MALKAWYKAKQKPLLLAIQVFVLFYYAFPKPAKWPGFGITSDEAFSAFWSHQPLASLWSFFAEGNNTPFYETLLHFWQQWVGSELNMLRMPSQIFYGGTALLIYFLARKISGNGWLSLGVALMCLFSNELLQIGLLARSYALLMFFSSASVGLAIHLYFNPNGKSWMLKALVDALLLYTHYLGAVFLVIQYLLLLPRQSKPLRIKYSATALLSLLLFSPWILTFIRRSFRYYEKGSWLQSAGWDELKLFFAWLGNGNQNALIWLIPTLSAIGLASSWLKISRRSMHWSPNILLHGLGWISLLSFFGISQFMPVFELSYQAFLMPFFYLSAALALNELVQQRLREPFTTLMVALFVLFGAKTMLTRQVLQPVHDQPWEAMSQFIPKPLTGPIYIHPDWHSMPFLYSFDRNLFDRLGQYDFNASGFYPVSYHKKLLLAMDTLTDVFLVLGYEVPPFRSEVVQEVVKNGQWQSDTLFTQPPAHIVHFYKSDSLQTVRDSP